MIKDLDTEHQLAQKLLNYGALTGARDVHINLEKLGIIERLKEHGGLKTMLPRPINQENIGTSGLVMGEHLHVNLTSRKAIQARLRQARQARRTIRKNVFAITALRNKQNFCYGTP